MSKNQSATPQMILCQTTDLSAAVDALRAEMGDDAPSKSQMLNILAATLCGPRRNWGFIKTAPQPVVSQRLEPELNAYIDALMEARPDLGSEQDTFEETVFSEAYDTFLVAFENDSDVTEQRKKGAITDEIMRDFCHQSADIFTEQWSGNPLFVSKVLDKGPSYIVDAVMDEAERRLQEFLEDPTADPTP